MSFWMLCTEIRIVNVSIQHNWCCREYWMSFWMLNTEIRIINVSIDYAWEQTDKKWCFDEWRFRFKFVRKYAPYKSIKTALRILMDHNFRQHKRICHLQVEERSRDQGPSSANENWTRFQHPFFKSGMHQYILDTWDTTLTANYDLTSEHPKLVSS